jgi:hypothetical protein
MLEYLSAHVGTVEEMQDYIVALCSEEVVKAKTQDEAASKALSPAPLNYVPHLGASVNYFKGSSLLKLFTPRDCNFKVTQLWATAMVSTSY